MHLQCKTITPWVFKHPVLHYLLADICIIMLNAHKTLHQKKVDPSLQIVFWKYFFSSIRTTCRLPVNRILSSLATRPLSLLLPLPFSLACEGSLSHSETTKYCLSVFSFSFYSYTEQQQWWSECLECVCRCLAPLSPMYIECKSHPGWCCSI